jgi:hypothetical protein
MNRLGTVVSGLFAGVVVLGILGCQKAGSTKPPAVAQGNAPGPKQAEQPEQPRREARSAGEIIGSAGQNVRQGVARQANKTTLHQLGLFFQNFNGENGRPPRNKEEFITYIKQDAPKYVEELQDETYVVRWNTPMSSNNILIYERYPLSNGTRLVLLGDGSVHTMTEQEFQAALKASGK